MTLHPNRRGFLQMGAAAAALVAMPPVWAPVPDPYRAHIDKLLAMPPVRAVEYGYSLDDYLYETGFRDAEAAIAAAREQTSASFFVGRVTRKTLGYPDNLGELAVEWFYEETTMAEHMVEVLAGYNEDLDFEGELADAIWASFDKESSLDRDLRQVLADALARHGNPGAAAVVRAATSSPDACGPADDDPFWERVAADPMLQDGLRTRLVSWVNAHGLADCGHGIDISEKRSFHDWTPAARDPFTIDMFESDPLGGSAVFQGGMPEVADHIPPAPLRHLPVQLLLDLPPSASDRLYGDDLLFLEAAP